MPITPPRLDDRSYQDLVDELLARVPAHTPEWTPAQTGDPGRTLLELFAWLADTVLYRANLVPERQRLAFLELLGMPLRPAEAARGLVTLGFKNPSVDRAVTVAARARLSGAVGFETLSELSVLPIVGECYYKRALTSDEKSELADLIDGLRAFHDIAADTDVDAYVTTRAFEASAAERTGVDVVKDTADRSLWIALLAPEEASVASVKATLAGGGTDPATLSVGIAPAIELPASFDDIRRAGALAHGWSISTAELVDDEPVYNALRRLDDTTGEYTRRGLERLVLPGDVNDFGVLEGDARKEANAGVGDRPPRLDDPERLARLVAWLRLEPHASVESMALSWVGINAVEIDQRQTIRNRVVGVSDGSADQVLALTVSSVEADGFRLEVQEPGRGYVTWTAIEDLALAGRDDAVYALDAEAGSVRFGNGVRGRVPEAGARVRAAHMRSGGGAAGNLPPGSVTVIDDARGVDGAAVTEPLVVGQPVAIAGGSDAETLEEAERRIPSHLRHRNRAVTAADYRELAAQTPGASLGRVEVLPRFLPRQRRFDVPGVVSVMVLPRKATLEAPNPRPDQPLIQLIHDHLSPRRPLATELYVIGCEYVPIALAAGVTVRDGYGHDQTRYDVEQALRRFLWSLPPHGPQGEGWPLGKTVSDRELEVVAAQVKGVATVAGVELFTRSNGIWRALPRARSCDPVEVPLARWQLPELLAVRLGTDGRVPDAITARAPGAGAGGAGGGVALPVVPKVC